MCISLLHTFIKVVRKGQLKSLMEFYIGKCFCSIYQCTLFLLSLASISLCLAKFVVLSQELYTLDFFVMYVMLLTLCFFPD